MPVLSNLPGEPLKSAWCGESQVPRPVTHNPLYCVVPPYITEHLAHSAGESNRSQRVSSHAMSAAMRARRLLAQEMPRLLVRMPVTRQKHRLVYDAQQSDHLPGILVRSEGDPPVDDPAVNEAYDGSGTVFDFYDTLFSRNSLDDGGMSLVSCVHVAEPGGDAMDNAFWDGEQMAYGDGDGTVFRRFTSALDVIGHELTHGVQQFTSNLVYRGQPGALNEHFADVFGVLVRQWRNGEPAASASWLIGADVLVPAPTRRAIRDMEFPGTAFQHDPDLGTDPQPATMSQLYRGPADSGGVHLNSGIPNRAFALTAKALKGNAWETAGRIWYKTMVRLRGTAQFLDCARMTVQMAGAEGAFAKRAVRDAWKKVGISV